MRTSRFEGVATGRHRKSRDYGFSRLEVVAAAAVVSGVVVGGGVFVVNAGDGEERVQVADLSAASTPSGPAASTPAAQKAGGQVAEQVAGPVPTVGRSAAKPVAAAPKLAPVVKPVERAACSTTKGNVSLVVDALVHAMGAEGGTVRSEAAESKVLARPGKGNACTKNVKLFMGENYAFEGALPYGNWVLDIATSGAKKSVKVTVDRAAVTAPTQVLNGDCGGTASLAVKTVTGESLLGLTGALPGTKVTATRIPDGECAIPAESSFVTGVGGSYVGTIGYGDWMFTVEGPGAGVSEFVTVGKNTDDVVLVQDVDLLG
ncbi:MAG: hypothetical protein ACT4QF_18990 [Sporichthyaceae bacterium]